MKAASNEDRARAYLAKLPPAISGQGGHAATFTAACRLVEFGLQFEQATKLLGDWNESHCQPLWTEGELARKLADAFKRTSAKPEFAHGTTQPVSMKPATPPKPTPSAVNRQPLALNVRKGTRLLFSVLAETRGLSARGVALASKRGLVRFGRYRDQAAWFLLDASRRNACARRLDGGQWFAGTDDRAKSLIIRGAHAAWPIGIQEAQPFETILLCEGGPDLLAAFHFIAAQCREFECAAVAMLSASYSIPAETLPLFAGKRVRIFPHDDSTGYRAASQWTAQLKPHAAAVDSFTFRGLRNRNGEKVKDLNDFARAKLSDQALPTSLLP